MSANPFIESLDKLEAAIEDSRRLNRRLIWLAFVGGLTIGFAVGTLLP